jgi:RNA-directed DNA polymerase
VSPALHSLDPASVFAFNALWAAAHRAARGKRMAQSVARYRLDLEPRLLRLRDELLAGRWAPGAVRTMVVHDGKPRRISVPPFGDRVVHQALSAVLTPRIERRMIRDTYACREGEGTHAAFRRARAWSRTYGWWVRLDVQRYFPTIDHGVVRAQLAVDVPHPVLRSLCERILDASGDFGAGHRVVGEDLFATLSRKAGLPLGSLLSQLWANRLLDPVDHLVKDRLRHRAYLRYKDDMLLFDDDRARLEALARTIEGACHDLRLRLHPWCAQPTAAGVGFVGYRIKGEYVRVRRSSVRRADGLLRRALRDAGGDLSARAFVSARGAVFGHWSHADDWRLRTRTLRRLGILAE